MCGICGIIDHRGGYINQDLIRRMSGAMIHRGPDAGGVYISRGASPAAGLGHRRLGIIDLSPLGNQPMASEDGKTHLVMNGEIYNYKELRGQMEKRGHVFKSHTDTETVLHLYEEYGEDCVLHLRGMFAFAIWDERNSSLFIARDRIGKKPLLYYHNDGRFCFASEFVSILESGMIAKKINYVAMDHYLTFGYIPAPLTIYEGVYKLPPAHTLVLKDGNITLKRYWSLDYSRKISISEDDAASELIRLLKEAVRIRLYSDVPLGAFLSGGIDSSAVVALMSQVAGGRVKTFSVGFEEKDYSELKYAKKVARRYGTDHHEFIVKPDAMTLLPLLVERYGEPYADSSCIPSYYVCSEAKRFVTVALNGDGGDESFAGYQRYQAVLASGIYQKFPGFSRKIFKNLTAQVPDSLGPKNLLVKIKRFAKEADLPFVDLYIRWINAFSRQDKDGLYSREFSDKVSGVRPEELLLPYLKTGGDVGALDRLLSADVNTYLPDDLLVKFDIVSMANSLEARSPLLDHKVMEFAASLPPQYKMKHFIKKWILKKAVKDLLPAENIHRPKMGFGVPVGKWFKGELEGALRQTLLSGRALTRGYFNEGAVKRMIDDHTANKRDNTIKLWTLFMLEKWHERFIDR